MAAFITAVSAGIVALDLAIIAAIVVLFTSKRSQFIGFVRSYAWLLIFLLAACSIAGTLVMQYAGLLAPCMLCWWQRIFMYPLALIALVALIKNSDVSKDADYVLVLAIPGALVALYQHLLQILPQGSLIPCDAANECAVRSVFEFGFVTIPWMALTVFAALALIGFIARKR
ncbi:MAG TPA: disulfide bond formation protein B [Candidatus Paceibacterota bacterium]|nr:disulfide bond formation protein B [Candidatus Paceibacterota bacterium]